jgi:ligand-binding sensor domain-containing protein
LVFYIDGTWSIGWNDEVFAVAFGSAGSAYIVEGQENRTVRQYADGEWLPLPPIEDPYTGPALYVAADDAVWIGALKGAFRYDGKDWRQFTARDGLPHDQVYAIAEDADGWLWFGTANGAARVNPATLDLTSVQR